MFVPSLPPRMVVRRLLSDHATRLAQPHLRHAYVLRHRKNKTHVTLPLARMARAAERLAFSATPYGEALGHALQKLCMSD